MKILSVVVFFLAYFMLSATPVWSESVSGKVYKELTEIQTIMGEGKSSEARTRLKTLLSEVKSDSLDKALTLQTLGYVEMAKEDFPSAIRYLKQSLDLKKLPPKVVINVGYMVAQLHAALGEYDQALQFAESWYTELEAPKPTESIFLANIYAQMKRYKESIPYAEKAIQDAKAPKETWFQLLTASYYELKLYTKAAKSLKRMIEYWPEKASYWEQLASVYVMADNQASALAVLKLAFQQKLLKKQGTLKSLVQMAVSEGIPEHAARLLEASLDSKLIEENSDHLKLLAAAYTAARERNKAILVYQRMAEFDESGDTWIAISNIYIEQGSWKKAEAALRKALDKNLSSPGKAWLLLGIAQLELKDFDASRNSLRKSSAYEETLRSANRWMKYVDDRQREDVWLASASTADN